MKLLIAVPAYNEEKSIGILVDQIKKYLPNPDILVVSDASCDQTVKKAQTAGCNVIDLPINLGVGNAVQVALVYALKNQYDYLIRLDGDLQHNPADIKKILQPLIMQKADVVIGSRFLAKGHTSTSMRLASIRIGRTIISTLLRQKITDPTSGYQGYNQKAMASLARFNSEDYPEIENLVICRKDHLRVTEVPVSMRRRQFGKSSITKGVAIYYMFKSIFLILINLYRREKNV